MLSALIENDLSSCNDFGGEFTLVNNGISTSKKYLCFDEKTEILYYIKWGFESRLKPPLIPKKPSSYYIKWGFESRLKH